MDEFVIYHVPREENPGANALAQQASSYNVRKRSFQEHKPLLTAECFALEAPVRPTQSTGLTDENGLIDVADRSDRSLRSGSVHGTGPTDAHDRSDWSLDKDSSSIFCDKNEVEDWRKPLVDYLHNLAVQLIEKSDDGLLSLFLMVVNCIVELRMICS
jgi:hypothetical protein